MANLIDRSYFKGPLILASLNTLPVRDALDDAITCYEPEFLKQVMGASLYAAFKAGLAEVSVAERWTWIRDGHTFTTGTRTYIWEGFKDTDTLVSPIANYVYWKYRSENFTVTTTQGEEKRKGRNASTPATVDIKMIRAWNSMVDMIQNLLAWLYSNGLYPEFQFNEVSRDVYSKQNILNI